MPPEKIWRGLW